MKKNIKPFLLPCVSFIVICLAISGLAGWVTESNIPNWFAMIQKPSFNPPNYIFGPVWTVLYIMIGISGGILWHYRKEAPKAFLFYIIQLVFNFLWSFIFFGAHQIGWAFIDIIVLAVFIAITICYAYKPSKTAAILLMPYLAWVIFACVLNGALWSING